MYFVLCAFLYKLALKDNSSFWVWCTQCLNNVIICQFKMVHRVKTRDDLVFLVFLKNYKSLLFTVVSLSLVTRDDELLLNKLFELKVAEHSLTFG